MENFMLVLNELLELEDSDENGIATLENMYEAMMYNEETINQIRKQMRMIGAEVTPERTQSEIDTITKMIDEMISSIEISERKEQAIKRILESISFIYRSATESYESDVVSLRVLKCHKDAIIPQYAHNYDAGFDFYLPEDFSIRAKEFGKIAPTGLKMQIPRGYELQIRPRSGNSVKTTLRIANAPGTIDSGYREEIGIICDNLGVEDLHFKKGDRLAQGVLKQVPRAKFTLIKDFSEESDRKGGFGSSGQ